MREPDFDARLFADAAELPPADEIVHAVTPWRNAMRRILWGFGLSTITLNFFHLQYLLPAIGILLLLLGFRTLRKENGWFGTCFALSALRTIWFGTTSILQATIHHTSLFDSEVGILLTFANLLTVLALFFCFWRGLRAVVSRADPAQSTGSAAALVVWYALVCVLAYVPIGGSITAILLLIVYICTLVSLREVSRSLDAAGYEISPAGIRISDRWLAIVIALAALTGLTLASIFGTSYEMDFTAHTPYDEAVRAELAALGFPAEIAADLTSADLAALAGAQEVITDVSTYPVNEGREVTTRETVDGVLTIHTTTVYDERELQITGIAVRLAGEEERWMLIHHFRWLIDPGFFGTEAMQLWTADRSTDKGWRQLGELSGQVLYDKGGQSYVAPYAFLGRTTYNSNSMFFGNSVENDVFAEFSLPRRSENQRGYVAYTVGELDDGWIIDSWMNYVHQTDPWQYPAKTAAEHKKAGGWSHHGAFCVVQSAIQFFPDEGQILE
ncbi:MAG: hypothetical protein IKC99_07460 [Clostridia bacterium]|nr:hypothetical protein [Clostridia bacterium]